MIPGTVLSLHRFIEPFANLVNDLIGLDPVLLQLLAFGVLLGGIYGLAALGLTMIFGVMDVINFAHGAFLTVGVYVLWQASELLNINPFVAMPIAVLGTFILGVVIHRFTIEPIIEAPQQNQLIVTFGIGLILSSIIEIRYSPNPRSLNLNLGELEIAGVFIPHGQLYALVIAILATILTFALLQYTDVGRAIRGTAVSQSGARYVGINVTNINTLTFGIGGALAGLAGASLGIYQRFDPYIGNAYLINAFIVVVLGGLGSFPGAIAGGMVIGIIQVFGGFYLPGTTYQVLIFLIFIATLMIKPEGLLGTGGERVD